MRASKISSMWIKLKIQEHADEHGIDQVGWSDTLETTGLYYLIKRNQEVFKSKRLPSDGFIDFQIWAIFHREKNDISLSQNKILYKRLTDIDLENFERRLSSIGYEFTKDLNSSNESLKKSNKKKLPDSYTANTRRNLNNSSWISIIYKIKI